MALLMPVRSKSLKFKFMAIGLLAPWLISMRLMRSGSNGGMDKPLCPFGCFCTMSVITFGRQTVSAALHCGRSVAETQKWHNMKIHFRIKIESTLKFCWITRVVSQLATNTNAPNDWFNLARKWAKWRKWKTKAKCKSRLSSHFSDWI